MVVRRAPTPPTAPIALEPDRLYSYSPRESELLRAVACSDEWACGECGADVRLRLSVRQPGDGGGTATSYFTVRGIVRFCAAHVHGEAQDIAWRSEQVKVDIERKTEGCAFCHAPLRAVRVMHWVNCPWGTYGGDW